ncbi:putative membrane protein [Sinorhizobium kostiense]|uniref:Membrane protein n=1 Tax=Sinorhizobium kostiense TaxID=76747 RepID=A0ABS4QUD8_9HYPH|nr:VanZ family protein [Sinorhizobium kostiense]MBP2234260.1 putative membrane protein [Sinorhizobium kostiense]
MNFRRAVSILAWLLFGFIAYSTLSPIGMRPQIGNWVQLERFGAYGLLGFLYAVAYPKRPWLVLSLLLAAAIGLELLQAPSADRHARPSDVAVKMAGTACGIGAAWFFARFSRRFATKGCE